MGPPGMAAGQREYLPPMVVIPLLPSVGRAIDRAVADRVSGPIFSTAMAPGWTATPPPDGFAGWLRLPGCGGAADGIPTCCATPT
jgi:hypothetical protein